MTYPVLEVRGLVNRFGSQVVHDGLDMEVHEDEVFGIVGGSGTGKSVLLRSVLGLQRPQAGTIHLEGHDITQLSGAALRAVKARYGVTFQQGALYSALTVLQNVQLPMVEYLQELSTVARDELAMLKIRLVGLPADAARKYPAELSGGMIKRAALARALALDPRLLFLDEPTSGLDPISAAEFDELMLYLQRQLRLTVVMITHDLDSIFRTCNRVGVIVDHKMETDTLESIVDHPNPWIQAILSRRARQHSPQGGPWSVKRTMLPSALSCWSSRWRRRCSSTGIPALASTGRTIATRSISTVPSAGWSKARRSDISVYGSAGSSTCVSTPGMPGVSR